MTSFTMYIYTHTRLCSEGGACNGANAGKLWSCQAFISFSTMLLAIASCIRARVSLHEKVRACQCAHVSLRAFECDQCVHSSKGFGMATYTQSTETATPKPMCRPLLFSRTHAHTLETSVCRKAKSCLSATTQTHPTSK